MENSIYGIRSGMREGTLKNLRSIKLAEDANDNFTPSDLEYIILRATVMLYEQHNPGVQKGWAGIVEETGDLANIKSDTHVDPEKVIKNTVDVNMKDITESAHTKKCAYRGNSKSEAGVGAKLGTKDWFLEQVGLDATRTILIGADGKKTYAF